MADEFDRYMDKMNTMNKESAKAQMDFQERLSNSSHQREVKDLIAAGLNPVLSANNGASSPQGAYANIDNTAVSAKFARQNLERELANQRTIAQMNNQNAMKIAQAQIASSYALGIYQANSSKEASMYNTDMQKTIKELDIENPNTFTQALIRIGQNLLSGENGATTAKTSAFSDIISAIKKAYANSNMKSSAGYLSFMDNYRNILAGKSMMPNKYFNYYTKLDKANELSNKAYRNAIKSGLSKAEARDEAAKIYKSYGFKVPKKYSYQ